MMTRKQNRGLHDRLLAAFRNAGLEPHPQHAPSVFGAVLSLVAAATGWVPASKRMAAQAVPGVRAVSLAGFSVDTGFDVIWWRESPHPSVRDLIEIVREIAERLR